jgi:hypothetical protein
LIFDIFNEEKSENYDEDCELQEENWNNYENSEREKKKNQKFQQKDQSDFDEAKYDDNFDEELNQMNQIEWWSKQWTGLVCYY